VDEKPTIVAPVMRFLGVADTARSAEFYRNVLGFEIRETDGKLEAICGPARIQFGKHDYAPLEWENPRPAGSAMLFFQTNDVAAMHAGIRARGGHPSGVERVNWIKMRMFAVRDPDEHTLWFGQSDDAPETPASRHMLRQIMPGLPLDDVFAGVAHYRDLLGFKVNYQQRDLAVMDRDDIRLLLIARTEKHKGIGSAYVYVESADVFCAELRARGANVRGDPVSQPWGLREFLVLDPEGNEITFGQPFE
jgi:catechol 2,3-dioxygenase-like lactoylglutathione lyase family enzyme